MLVVVGSIHGNEPAGAGALETVVERLSRENLLERGDQAFETVAAYADGVVKAVVEL